MRNLYVFGFATFGHPNDFRQSPFIYDSQLFAKHIRIYDLTNAIKVFPNSTIYSIRKELVNGIKSLSYSIYTHAKEQESTREGTFIGSSILYSNEISEEKVTIDRLNNFHQALVETNTKDNTLTVDHSRHFSISPDVISSFDHINDGQREIDGIDNYTISNSNLIVFSRIDHDTLTLNFKNSLELLNKYDTIYFTSDKNVIDYSRQRNIYSVVDENGFQQEILGFQNDKKQKILNTISDYETEKQKLEEDRKIFILDLKAQIGNNEKVHSENERILADSKDIIDKVETYYSQFSRKIDDHINQLKSGSNRDVVKEVYNENKRIFITSINESKQPIFLKKIEKVRSNSRLRTESNTNVGSGQRTLHTPQVEHTRVDKPKYALFKVLTLVFAFLWLSSSAYFLFIENSDLPQQIVDEPSRQGFINPSSDETKKIVLNPSPNAQLNDNDIRLIRKQNLKDKSAKEIVDIIFKKNPTDIANFYNNQRENYMKLLIEKNRDCFLNDICIKDSIRNVPSFEPSQSTTL